MSHISEKAVNALRWLAGARFLAQAFNWAITILVIRLLSPGDYGLMALAMVAINLLTLINEMGLGAVIVQKEELDDNTIAQLFGFLLVINAAFFAISVAAAPAIALFFDEPRLTSVLVALSLLLVLSAVSVVQVSMLQRRMLFRQKAIVDFVAQVSGSVATLTCALMGQGVWSLVIGALLTSAVHTIGAVIALRHWYRPRFSLSGMRKSIEFGSMVTANHILWFLYSEADVLIIGKLLGKEILGVYSVARTLAELPMKKLSGILNEVAFSAFSRLQDDRETFKRHYLNLARIISLFSFAVFFGISCTAPEIVNIFLGEKWGNVLFPLQILSLTMPLGMLSGMIQPAVIALGRPDVTLGNLAFACILMPTAFLIGVNWGIEGVSIAWLIGYPIHFSVVLYRSLPVMGIRLVDYLYAIYPPGLAAGVMYGAVVLFRDTAAIDIHQILILMMLAATGAASYCLAIYLLRKETFAEAWWLIRQ